MSRMRNSRIQEMRTKYKLGMTIPDIAVEYGISTLTALKYCENEKPVVKKLDIPHCEGITKSYRDNILWAMDAAGDFRRSETHPISCPNNSAWFLYMQALDEPKDFMAKVSSMEAKLDPCEMDREIIASSRKTLCEIEAFLKEEVENGEKED